MYYYDLFYDINLEKYGVAAPNRYGPYALLAVLEQLDVRESGISLSALVKNFLQQSKEVLILFVWLKKQTILLVQQRIALPSRNHFPRVVNGFKIIVSVYFLMLAIQPLILTGKELLIGALGYTLFQSCSAFLALLFCLKDLSCFSWDIQHL